MSIKSNIIFIALVASYLLFGSYVILHFPKGEVELWINSWNTPYLDFFFKYGTWLGDGIFYALVMIFLLFVRYYYFIIGLIVVLVKSIVVQYLKLVVYHYEPRPYRYFFGRTDVNIHYVDGVEINEFNSFPSGHTSTAFALFALLSIIYVANKWRGSLFVQVFFFLTAFMVGISRIYLFQHFFVDTYFGTLFGFLSAFFVYFLVDSTQLKNKKWIQRSVLR